MRLILVTALFAVSAAFTTSAFAAEPLPMLERDRAAEVTRELEASTPDSTHLVVRGAAGPVARALFDSYSVGAGLDLGVGVDSSVGSYALAVSAFGGVLEGGLEMVHVTAGFDMSWALGIVRLGLTPRIGYLAISRITSERQFGAYTFGLAARLSVDLYRDEGLAIALGAEPTADVVAALGNDGASADSAASLAGGGLLLEVRWRRAE
ncbi:MAG: hypothetical protein U0271_08180 [Polyangiaceae bacterium]